jgi:hypothetical protein
MKRPKVENGEEFMFNENEEFRSSRIATTGVFAMDITFEDADVYLY